MRIGLDFDGVLSDCGALKTKAALEIYGKHIPPETFKKEIVVGEGHLTAEEYLHLQRIIYGTHEVGMQMTPVPGMKEYITKLQEEGYDLHIITSRGPVELAIAQTWVALQGLSLPFTGVGYDTPKTEAAQAQAIDIYIDDDLDKLRPLHGVVPHLFLMHWGYNAADDHTPLATRVHTWEAFYQAIHSLGR